MLCENISENVGSDCLFEEGVLAEAVVGLRDVGFEVHIRRNKANRNGKYINSVNSFDKP